MFMNVAAERASLRKLETHFVRPSAQMSAAFREDADENRPKQDLRATVAFRIFPNCCSKNAQKPVQKGVSREFVAARATQCDSKANTPR
ncbi:hypothetical protein JQ543_30800 [Bradyrhizobium diazoefficiens]|nr:hypothetical protein [Bradyrhizobium diazoefficiens]MBR0852160.1 hypothetical protein [Bradyrhizobium diazoefficiens]